LNSAKGLSYDNSILSFYNIMKIEMGELNYGENF